MAPDQPVITTGPYATVRHPMYLGSWLCCIGIPRVSVHGGDCLLLPRLRALIVVRLRMRIHLCKDNLPGYKDYAGQVHVSALAPFVW